jgi:hypothetical protein
MNVAKTDKWIVHKLSSDTVLQPLVFGVYGYTLPQGVTFPLINFSLLSSTDVPGSGSNRVLSNVRYIIKVISRDNLSVAVIQADRRIDEIFQNVKAENFEGYSFTARREQTLSFEEKTGDADIIFRHIGAIYKFQVSKL